MTGKYNTITYDAPQSKTTNKKLLGHSDDEKDDEKEDFVMDGRWIIKKKDRKLLRHMGVLGMHWGERRYQNEDGSLTPEGREHYGVGESNKKQSIFSKAKTLVQKTIGTYGSMDMYDDFVKRRAEESRQEWMAIYRDNDSSDRLKDYAFKKIFEDL